MRGNRAVNKECSLIRAYCRQYDERRAPFVPALLQPARCFTRRETFYLASRPGKPVCQPSSCGGGLETGRVSDCTDWNWPAMTYSQMRNSSDRHLADNVRPSLADTISAAAARQRQITTVKYRRVTSCELRNELSRIRQLDYIRVNQAVTGSKVVSVDLYSALS